jgi:hypothetical protein
MRVFTTCSFVVGIVLAAACGVATQPGDGLGAGGTTTSGGRQGAGTGGDSSRSGGSGTGAAASSGGQNSVGGGAHATGGAGGEVDGLGGAGGVGGAGVECKVDDDCPMSKAPCQLCSDGSSACPWAKCDEGVCTAGIDTCEDVDPCAGKSCGDACTTCAPDLPCPPVVMFCDADLKCQLAEPLCDAKDPCGGCELPNICVYQVGGPGPSRYTCAEQLPCGAPGACACIVGQGQCGAELVDGYCSCDNGLE